jgi:hypothetical protein
VTKEEFIYSVLAAGAGESYLRYVQAGYELIGTQYEYDDSTAIVRVNEDCVYAVPWIRLPHGTWTEKLYDCYRVYQELRPVWVPVSEQCSTDI